MSAPALTGASYTVTIKDADGFTIYSKASLTPNALTSAVYITLSIVLGEFAALRAIMRGSGNEIELEFAFAAIAGCLLLITIEMMSPLVHKLSRRAGDRLLLSLASLWVALGIYAILISSGVLPL
ncbi:hypothetical protein [Arthrobacter sp. B2a2-09]|uniref:hypothetical protein n=1 Tax=Arthrobacter sp. B2a2-09 TaxID=2952822 RepID=UPI0022CD815E|nr:hypothetical protein [Arthrobacter sp. B2a2-09]MCZ9880536.1 hypothetical protein [Arthrobacter sp. B2a2-09]